MRHFLPFPLTSSFFFVIVQFASCPFFTKLSLLRFLQCLLTSPTFCLELLLPLSFEQALLCVFGESRWLRNNFRYRIWSLLGSRDPLRNWRWSRWQRHQRVGRNTTSESLLSDFNPINLARFRPLLVIISLGFVGCYLTFFVYSHGLGSEADYFPVSEDNELVGCHAPLSLLLRSTPLPWSSYMSVYAFARRLEELLLDRCMTIVAGFVSQIRYATKKDSAISGVFFLIRGASLTLLSSPPSCL